MNDNTESVNLLEHPVSKEKQRSTELILLRAGRHHFAFLKGYLEGLDISDLAQRYLETAESSDIHLRTVYATLKWIRSDLRALARRHGKFGFARVIGIDPNQIVDHGSKVPTLDEYREERDPYETYTEAELIELFEEEYAGLSGNAKAVRNVRLRRRQADALTWLGTLVFATPSVNDTVGGWLQPYLANRLTAAGIVTIKDLFDVINGRGLKWYGTVDRLGQVSAERIVKWLKLNEESLGTKIQLQATIKRSDLNVALIENLRPIEQAIVPFEYFRPLPHLSGSEGLNRGDRNQSGAFTDHEAITIWLRTKTDLDTVRSYRKEAERLLMWAVLERGKPLSSIDGLDCALFVQFLNDMGRVSDDKWAEVFKIPQNKWMGKKGSERWSSLWRPFERPYVINSDKEGNESMVRSRSQALSPASQKQATTILRSMFSWMVKAHYLHSNPWDLIPVSKGRNKIDVSRSFTKDQWKYLMVFLDSMEPSQAKTRLSFILRFTYITGLRLSELAQAKIVDIKSKTMPMSGKKFWKLDVIGKGKFEREVPLPSSILNELDDYLKSRNMDGHQSAPSDTPLIERLIGVDLPGHKRETTKASVAEDGSVVPIEDDERTRTLTQDAIYKILKSFFRKAAAQLEKDSEDAIKLNKASTHWLRHTCATHAISNKVPIETIRKNFGHQSIDTTSIYIDTELLERMEQMESFADKAL